MTQSIKKLAVRLRPQFEQDPIDPKAGSWAAKGLAAGGALGAVGGGLAGAADNGMRGAAKGLVGGAAGGAAGGGAIGGIAGLGRDAARRGQEHDKLVDKIRRETSRAESPEDISEPDNASYIYEGLKDGMRTEREFDSLSDAYKEHKRTLQEMPEAQKDNPKRTDWLADTPPAKEKLEQKKIREMRRQRREMRRQRREQQKSRQQNRSQHGRRFRQR